ncbi:MAG: hypothetical protein AMJ93_05700 [Anaerolineae bacterium SM23_84]|nr:MAG: hypothetical protein AMJ93_05700 [Anaerolineae bacterium SM23_84]
MTRLTLREYLDEARELISAADYEDAVAICRHILQRYPKHIRTYQILGEACLEKGDFDEATDIFKRLLEHSDPENFVAYAGLGILSEEKGHIAQAIWYMERAFEIAPNNDEVRSALRRLYGKRDGTEPTRIKHNKAALARLYARGGQYRQAIDKFYELLELEPNRDRMDLKVALAETLWRDERREQAAEIARELLEPCPDCLKAVLLLGMIQLEKGRDDEGWAILDAVRGLDPENRMAQAVFGKQTPLPYQEVRISTIMDRPEAQVEPAAIAETPVAPLEEETPAPAPAEEEVIPEERPEAEAVATEVAAAEPEAIGWMEEEVEVLPTSVEEAAAVAAAQPEAEELAPEAVPAEVSEEALEAEAAPVPGEPIGLEESLLASVAVTAPEPLSDVERYKLQLEQQPKDDETRLALARAYRDQEQMKLALEQYTILKRGRAKLLSEVIQDMETMVASRPDNLEAHELLADLYVKDGQLQQAVDRYRWILQRLDERTA